MKLLMAGILLLTVVSVCSAAVTVDQIVKLTRLKTSEEVIIGLIEKQGLEKPLASADVVYLKEQGVSDKIIQHLLKQAAERKTYDNNLRTYYTTGKDGRQVLMATNLDENGERMGPPPLPPYVPVYPEEPPAPKEILVTVRNEQPPPPPEEQEDQAYEEPNGIPYSPYDPYLSYGYGYSYPFIPAGGMFPGPGSFRHGHHPAGVNRPIAVRPSATPRPVTHRSSHGTSAGMPGARRTR